LTDFGEGIVIHTLTDGITAEMGVVGREGVVGVGLFMG
jgi:hypothetical protein